MYEMNYCTDTVNFLGWGAYFENLTFGGALIRSFTVDETVEFHIKSFQLQVVCEDAD